MGVLINPEKPGKVREFRNASRFAAAVASRAADKPGTVEVEVVIQAREHRLGSWVDLVEYWSGPWSPDLPVPTRNDLIAAGRSVGTRYVRHVVRTTV